MHAQDFSWEPKSRVLVVDAHSSIAELVSILLNREGRYVVIGEAVTGAESFRLFQKYQPDLVITSLSLPDTDGAALIALIQQENPGARILVYSGSGNRRLFLAAQQAGANGFSHKSESLAVLRTAIDAVAHGASFISPHAAKLLKAAGQQKETEGQLSPKERIVLRLIADGMSSKEIGARISVVPKTVDYYRAQIMQKLGMNSIAALTRYAVRVGLVSAECWMLASLFDG